MNSVDYRSDVVCVRHDFGNVKSAIFGGIQHLIGTNVDWLPVIERFFSPSCFTDINLVFKLHKDVTH